MNRLIHKNIDNKYFIDERTSLEDVFHRLWLFENTYESLTVRQESIPGKLENMRINGKEKTVKYKEMVAEKLINNSIKQFFDNHGISY